MHKYAQRGNCGKDEPIETFLDEARYLLTSEETDYSNYMPEDDFSEWGKRISAIYNVALR